jgi:hypothetical protein
MSDDWCISDVPDRGYLDWVVGRRALFASPMWSQALQALGAHSKFVWSSSAGQGIQLACFRRGPLRVGVLGFPVVGEDWDVLPEQKRIEGARSIGARAGLHMLRINRSMLATPEPAMTTARAEVWIDPLAQWSAAASRRVSKDLAFARRVNPQLQLVENAIDPDACFGLYAATVRANAGKLVYNRDYFASLMHIARQSDWLRVIGVHDRDRALRGFAVSAIHGDSAFYLHGGVDAQGKREGVSDLQLAFLVDAARDAGCRRFSLLSSPWDQPGLLRYKRKWGDCIGLSVTEDIGFGVLGRTGQRLSRWLARHDRDRALAWFGESSKGEA